jgi:uncharacterized membrane protein
VAEDAQEIESRAVDRVIFFSDAVVAIAITLLAIDLPVPHGSTLSAFWSSAIHDNGTHYLAFLVSFYAIAAKWTNHHDAFRFTRRMDSRLRWLNMLWLLMIVIIPFATRLLTEPGQQSLDVNALEYGFYALVQALGSAIMIIMLRHMAAHRQAPDMPPPTLTGLDWQSYALTLGFGLSIPVFFATRYGWVIWIVVPLLIRRIHRLRARKHPGAPAARRPLQPSDGPVPAALAARSGPSATWPMSFLLLATDEGETRGDRDGVRSRVEIARAAAEIRQTADVAGIAGSCSP